MITIPSTQGFTSTMFAQLPSPQPRTTKTARGPFHPSFYACCCCCCCCCVAGLEIMSHHTCKICKIPFHNCTTTRKIHKTAATTHIRAQANNLARFGLLVCPAPPPPQGGKTKFAPASKKQCHHTSKPRI